MKVSVEYAEQHFAEVLSAADKGEEVEIARADKPSLFITPHMASRTGTPSGRPRRELWGAWEGLIAAPTQEKWDEIHHQFLNEMPDLSKLTGVGD